MYSNRLIVIFCISCVLLALVGLPLQRVLAAPASKGANLPPSRRVASALLEIISAGKWNTCWLQNDSTIACWGDNTLGLSTPPLGTFINVSAGNRHACAVKTGGGDNAVCWGEDTSGDTQPPLSTTFAQVAAGYYHTCGVKSGGSLACWGDDIYNQVTNTPAVGTFTQVSAGAYHSCALKSPVGPDDVVCWGDISLGQSTPPLGMTFTQVSAGAFHTCALKSSGVDNVVCWGDNSYGQAAPPAGTFTQVSAGGSHTCGLKNDATVACWGFNGSLQSAAPSGTFTQVSAGGLHTCGLRTSGALTCWGDNAFGQASTFTISGNAGASGVTLSYFDSIDKTVMTDANGNFFFQVEYNWSGTLTPSKAGVTFTPASRSFISLTADQPGQNYAATVSFTSIGKQDGWVLESTEFSGVGGWKDALATTFILGDDNYNRQYRAILSFNTASLPDSANIQYAQLKIKKSGVTTGSNPFTKLGKLWVDIRTGSFGTLSLALTDFKANASAAKVTYFNKAASSTWYSTYPVNATGLTKVNKIGVTQFRLYFALDDNNNVASDYMNFFSGNYGTLASRPQLIITYNVP